MPNKFGAKKTYSALCQREFASRAEARRGEELALLQKAGVISCLEYQPKFVLCLKPRITYTADFRYVEDGKVTVEDVKGMLQRETRVKLAWLAEKNGIEVTLVKGR